jgi:uncharacterized caspase-like protein
MAKAIQEFFHNCKDEDLLLFHFSGHGVKSETGVEMLANSQTTPDDVDTGFAFTDLISKINGSKSKKIGLIIDCCYS